MSEKIVQLNEEVIKGQIKELVRGSVEETLNELLEKEAESLTQAARYERSEERQAVERAMRELAFVGLDDQYANLAGNLAYGNQRLLEIARALASEPRFLILDEPAGGMNDQETADLMLLIKAIQKRGITILLIEHDMNLVMRVCEKIVVLENGALIAEGTSAEIKRNPRVIEAYLGAEG